jgi:hypothetical protein
MLEYIKFYTKNLSNFTILLLIGVVIAILDITLRNVIKGVYLNVRENMRIRHGGGGREGMENKDGAKKGAKDGDEDGGGGGGGGGSGGSGGGSGGGDCPKDCNAVEALRNKLTGLIENASKLQKDIQQNNDIIKYQHRTIENMQKSVQKLTEKAKK